MKNLTKTFVAAGALFLAGASVAEARPFHRHHHHHHRYFSPGRAALFAAPLLLLPRYVYPAPAYQYSPPLYVEQPPAYLAPQPVQPLPQVQPQPSPQAYWYYCQALGGYYPQVQSCPGGWQHVLPQNN